MKLYEIDAAILECIDLETGEIIDEDEIDFEEFDDEEEEIPDEEYALPNHSLMDNLRLKSNI